MFYAKTELKFQFNEYDIYNWNKKVRFIQYLND